MNDQNEQNRKIIPLAPQRSALDRYRRTDASVLTSPLRRPSYAVMIRRPTKNEFIRTRLFAECLGPFPLLVDRDNDRFYAVDRSLWELLTDHLVEMALIPAAIDTGRIFLWPVRLPDADGRLDSWNDSAMRLARCASTSLAGLAASRTMMSPDNSGLAGRTSSAFAAPRLEPLWSSGRTKASQPQ